MADDPDTAQANGTKLEGAKSSAAEKSRARRKKAKDHKKELKEQAQKVREKVEKLREIEAKNQQAAKNKEATEPEVVIEYVSAPLEGLDELRARHEAAIAENDPYAGLGVEGLVVKSEERENPFDEIQRLAKYFGTAEDITGDAQDADDEADAEPEHVVETKKAAAAEEDGDDDDDEDEEGKLSRKKRKAEMRMKIAELKKECPRPEVVEVWDVTAQDPKLLVYLKAYRNTVPVPRHWSQKRKFLQGKRGLEKPPFELPSFIQATGVGDMRNTQAQNVDEKMKNKGRQRMRPKMGKMDIDYNVLHNAFFKYQSKPKMTQMGDMYYEGKEFEMKPQNVYPGILSPALREALGMDENAPPPWLINMQRYGPPPSYPSLKIPGLNAPIPPGAEFGYQTGQWGKPPVDEAGNPVYGDVFGLLDEDAEDLDPEIKQKRWGEMEEEEDSSEEEESEEEEEGLTGEQLEQGIASGMLTGLASTLPGIQTDHTLDLRKGGGGTTTTGQPQQLYQVLPEQKATAADSTGLMGASHTYAMPASQDAARPADPAARKRLEMLNAQQGAGGSVDVALDPEELANMGPEELAQLYAERAGGPQKEDYSDMIAAHAAAKKRKLQEQASHKAKKQKDSFKF